MRAALSLCFLLLACPAAHAMSLAVESWPLPAVASTGSATPAAQPDLVKAPDGSVLLSWIAVETDSDADRNHALRFARLRDGEWSDPATIASGNDFFVNWADTPHLRVMRDGRLYAHWLRRNGDGVYDYGIALVHSDDGGQRWSEPQRIEPDAASLDYGFVSWWEHDDGTLGLAWLDSRRKQSAAPAAGGEHHHHGHGAGAGAMTLRSATLARDGTCTRDLELDASTCDCCPTAAAMTPRGPVVVYRGRSADEIRDIRAVAFDGAAWSQPRSVSDDGWRIAGCPVNGPSIAASGDAVAVAWYTEAGGSPRVRLARADASDLAFSPPHEVAHGSDVLGRVALAADDDTVWLAWLMNSGDTQALWLARFDAATLQEHARVQVATLQARGPASGLPRLVLHDGDAHLVWTDVIERAPHLRGARVRVAND